MGFYRERNGIWYARWRESGRLVRRSLKTKVKREAEEKWAGIRTAQAKAEIAGEDPERHTAGLSPNGLIAEYLADLERQNKAAQHISQRGRQLEKLFASLDISKLKFATSKRIAGALAKTSHLTPRTQHDYRAAAHAFFEWLVKSGRWARNPVASIRPVRELDEPKRRAMSPDELSRLLATAPRHRAIIYRLCAGCGLRRNEVRQLRREQFDLDEGSVTLRAGGTKAKRWAKIPITRGMVGDIENWLADPSIVETGRTRPAQKNPSRSCPDKAERWVRRKAVRGMLPPVPAIKTFETDLIVAGIEIEVNGRALVYHSIRATFVTNLWRRGHSAAEVCRYGRFRDVKTAMRYYTSFGASDDDLMRRRMEQFEDEAGIATIPATIPSMSKGAEKRPNMASSKTREKRKKAL